jgi:TRAP-type mannitol/chloroaromatic compound transport system permease large subunit
MLKPTRRLPQLIMAFIVLIGPVTLNPGHGAAQSARDGGIALVIGNSRYSTAPLKNPENDANAMALALTSAGFMVEKLIDATRTEMERAIIRFGRRLKKSQAVGLFYYAGHAVQIGGRNYLIPLGANIEAVEEIRVESVDIQYVLARMGAAANSMNLVILDSCRDNPFGFSSLSAPSGLAPVDAPPGTFIAYATAPGKVAADGKGGNGLYTGQLIRAMKRPGLKIEDVFKRVRREVAKQTDGLQVPWESSSLTGDFYFQPPEPSPGAPLQSQEMKAEITYWQSIRASKNPAMFRAYLSRYPDGTFSGLAKAKLEELMAPKTVAPIQPPVDFQITPLDEKLIAVKTANIRSQPAINSARVGVLVLGTPVAVTGKAVVEGKSWYRIERPGQPPAFVYSTLLGKKGASWFDLRMEPETFAVLLVVATLVLLLLGFPAAFTFGATAIIFAFTGDFLGLFDARLLSNIPSRYLGIMIDDILVAVPLFVFMWLMLARSELDGQLVITLILLFGRIRGGLVLAVLLAGVLSAAVTGFVGMTVGAFGLLFLPIILKAGYDKRLASGATLASGSLGYIAPPSIVLILLGGILQSANTDSQRLTGNWEMEPISVADLFAGAVLPSLLLLGLYLGWVVVKVLIAPKAFPRVSATQKIRVISFSLVIQTVVAPIVLLVVIIGSIFTSIASPTEAAGLGVIGAILLAGREKRYGRRAPSDNPQALAVADKAREDRKRKEIKTGAAYKGKAFRGGNWPPLAGGISLLGLMVLAAFYEIGIPRDIVPSHELIIFAAACLLTAVFISGLVICFWRAVIIDALVEAMRETVNVSSMVFVTFLGASVFVLVFRGFDGDDLIARILANLPGAPIGTMLAVIGTMFLLGFLLDFLGILLIFVPIVTPIILQMGVSPVWLGVMIIITLQVNYLLPPYGFALSRLRAIAPAPPRMKDSLRGVIPFSIIQLLGLLLIALFPVLATWLPAALQQ